MKNIRQRLIQDFFSKVIGVDYKEKDCWGIVKTFYLEIFGIELDFVTYNRDFDLDSDEWAATTETLITANKGKFTQVFKPQMGDIVLIRLYGIPAHLGIYLDEQTMLHTSEKTGCIIDRLSKWEKRIEGFYRYGQG